MVDSPDGASGYQVPSPAGEGLAVGSASSTDATHAIVTAGVSRSHPHETANGDGWAAFHHAHGCRIVVVDGLGHGPIAELPARAALDAVRASLDSDLLDALRRCHDALTGTRGAAVSVADVDLPGRRLVYAGIGNVEARLWQAATPSRTERPIVYRGIVGSSMPRLRAFEFPLDGDRRDWRLLIHTDGVSSRFDLQDTAGAFDEAFLRDAPPEAALHALAEETLSRWGRSTDDATVVVAAPGGAW